MTRYLYRHNGLTLSADEPLPRLEARADATSDVEIEIEPPGRTSHGDLPWVMPDPPIWMWRAETGDGTLVRLRYANEHEWAEYVIGPGGSRVWVARSENVELSEASELLLGPVFSCLLAARGVTCLHAAVVRLDGRALALVGASGAGKSTTTSAFLKAGASLIADDVAVLSEVDGRPAVHAGAPRLRIRPEAALAAGGSFDALEPMWVHEQRRPSKRYLPVVDEARVHDEDGPFALDAVYFLGARSADVSAPSLTPLDSRQALARLMAHRHMSGALDRSDHVRDFEVMARLAESVPARELRRPEDVSSVDETVALISSDACRLG